MTQPITPAEAQNKKEASVPKEIIEAFNELIVKHWSGGSARFKSMELTALAKQKTGLSDAALFEQGYFEASRAIFRKAGWEVTYDRPGYNETYDAFYIFRK